MLLEIPKTIPSTPELDELKSQMRPVVDVFNKLERIIIEEQFKKEAIEYINEHSIPLGVCVVTTSTYCLGPGKTYFQHFVLYNRMVVAESTLSWRESYIDGLYKTAINDSLAASSLNDILSYIKNGDYDFVTDRHRGAYHDYFNPFEPKWYEIRNLKFNDFVELTIIN